MKNRIVILIHLVLIVILAGCGGRSAQPPALNPTAAAPQASPTLPPAAQESMKITYTASDEVILNPERGFFSPVDFTDPSNYSVYRTAMGSTLVHTTVRLDDYRESDLPKEFLDLLDSRFADLRVAGVKLVLRFAYNNGPYPDSEPDASKAQVLKHLRQFTPLLQKNADVIAFVEAGFIGAWGEWHTSTNGLDNLADKREILFALLDALPASRMVQVRYPTDIIRMFPEPLTEQQAFDGSYQSRIGHHNDCFLSSATDVGTYEREGTNTIQSDQAYLAEITRFTPTGGETCAPNPPRSDCASALQEMALLHFTEINLSYHQRIIKAWQKQGCFVEMQKRLGYRLVLDQAEMNPSARPGGDLRLKVTLRNDGFASLINPRPLFVVLDGPQRYRVALPVDPRRWEGGKTYEMTARLRLPTNAPAGAYRVALWLPDEAPAPQDNPLYAVRFANQDTWDAATGWNILTDAFRVDPNAPGETGEASELTVLEASSANQ